MISVFGSTGFIGSRFCELFDREVVRIARDNYVPKTGEVLYLISTTNNYNVFDNPNLDIDTNLTVLVDVLKNCKNKGIVFNFVSSWFVYGKNESLPAREEDPCNPKGFYSITKRAAEQLVISFCETFKIKYRIFRLGNVYGEGDASVSKKKNALQYLIGEIIDNKDINLYDGGTNIRDFIYVDDVCRAMKLCMEKSDINNIVNISNGRPYQFLSLMEHTRDRVKSKSKFISVKPTEFHDIVQVKNMYLDTTKLKKLGFKPKISIEDGLNIVINHYTKRKDLR
jgi:nucleoside-diphosphate-sugar epimerase